MKRAFRHLTSGLRLSPVVLCAIVFSCATTAPALTEANPYSAIVGRNTFALKPPAPAAGPVVPPPTPPPNVSLQGISTILGRAQALLKVKIAPKPPDAAKELSLVMDVGQREGDVEVLEIDPAAGSVKLSNQGTPITLNIKDADKPAAGPALPVAAVVNTLPGIAPINPPPVQSVPSISEAGKSLIPTRPLRSEAVQSSGASQGNATAGQVGAMSPEGNVALNLLNRTKNEQLRESGVKIPKVPLHPFLKGTEADPNASR